MGKRTASLSSTPTDTSVSEPNRWDFDMYVGEFHSFLADNTFEGYSRMIDFARVAKERSVFSAPEALTWGELRTPSRERTELHRTPSNYFPPRCPGERGRMLDPYERRSIMVTRIIPTDMT